MDWYRNSTYFQLLTFQSIKKGIIEGYILNYLNS